MLLTKPRAKTFSLSNRIPTLVVQTLSFSNQGRLKSLRTQIRCRAQPKMVAVRQQEEVHSRARVRECPTLKIRLRRAKKVHLLQIVSAITITVACLAILICPIRPMLGFRKVLLVRWPRMIFAASQSSTTTPCTIKNKPEMWANRAEDLTWTITRSPRGNSMGSWARTSLEPSIFHSKSWGFLNQD